MELISAILILIFCFFTGKIIETNHYKSIRKRELKLFKKPYVTFAKNLGVNKKVKSVNLVSGSVVLGCDHFKAFVAELKNIFGGNVSSYESVLDRGRREAVLRMREQAYKNNADVILNVKIDTVMLMPIGTKHQPQVCVTAYGTAIKYAK